MPALPPESSGHVVRVLTSWNLRVFIDKMGEAGTSASTGLRIPGGHTGPGKCSINVSCWHDLALEPAPLGCITGGNSPWALGGNPPVRPQHSDLNHFLLSVPRLVS